MVTVFVIIIGVYVVVCAAAFLMQRQLIYHPFKHIISTPEAVGLDYEELKLQSPDGVNFIVWSIPNDSAKINVVYFHGNAENVSNNVNTYKLFHDLGVNVYAFEYRGYADAEGSPSEDLVAADLATFADYLRAHLNSGSHVVALGRSLGGGVAVKFTNCYPVDGLILESTFSSLADVGKAAFPYLPVSLLLREKYNSAEIIRTFDKPLLSIHSPDDEVIPYALGRKLYDAAIGEKRFVEITGSHNSGFLECDSILRDAYGTFLARFR